MNASKEEALNALDRMFWIKNNHLADGILGGCVNHDIDMVVEFLQTVKERLPSEAFYTRDEEQTT